MKFLTKVTGMKAGEVENDLGHLRKICAQLVHKQKGKGKGRPYSILLRPEILL